MKSVGFITIGCKLNQFETEQMREAIEAEGFRSSDARGRADVYVINTCTVTSKSDYRSRQAIRRAIRLNPEATIIVTGCYAQLAPEEVARIQGVDAIVGNSNKDRIVTYVALGKQARPIIDVEEPGRQTRLSSSRQIVGFGSYTRAFVKIQDGCDNRCTYCAVPLARGKSRSKPWDQVCNEVAILVERGYKEIVLTGVHLGSYGKDLADKVSLAWLLKQLSKVEGLERIRLSSVEPTDFSRELIDTISDPAYRICPHVHVPLQSGDGRILRLMGRTYSPRLYRNLIESIASSIPRCGIGADVMVGFPGEDDRAFANTLSLISDLPVTYLHVFAFSPRPNTVASTMNEQVPVEVKKERSRKLRELGKHKSLTFRQSLKGTNLEVLVLSEELNGCRVALSGNYVKVYLRQSLEPNEIRQVTVLEPYLDGVLGTEVSKR
ncbi:MAG TPA: tRNA (N(6)-L-threonylcarbamoyladenosine(37)-C(2))-methylthiotransferase MtaB [Firmicutes bacterium]|nr:tRNA (N(6)-L-threonylcarbamoyladenosine(37)-C(2))-methylthiotransferase MtaB [Bacillota bacterium]